MASAALATFLMERIHALLINVLLIDAPQINFPSDFNTNFLMLVRWIHFLAGITWIGRSISSTW